MEAFHSDIPTISSKPCNSNFFEFVAAALIIIPVLLVIIKDIQKTYDNDK